MRDSSSHDQSARIPSLDGIRALAIGAVLLGHLAGTTGFPAPLTAIIRNRFFNIASFGVGVFFVISGFLITGLLMREAEARGSVDLRRFYLRRTLRIFPAYFAFLGAVSVLGGLGWVTLSRGDLWHALTYTMNYAPDRSWTVGHLWSLAVEEQFYLLWPAVIAYAGLRRARSVAVAVLLLAPIARVLVALKFKAWVPMIGTTFETTADALAFGCVLALYREQLFARAWYRRLIGSRWPAIALLLAGVVLSLRFATGVTIGAACLGVGTALLLDRYVRYPGGLGGRLLNARPLVWVGTMSYSLYLWQQLFLNRNSQATATSFPLNLVLAFACAWASYRLIEQPILAKRRSVELWLRAWRARYRLARAASVGD